MHLPLNMLEIPLDLHLSQFTLCLLFLYLVPRLREYDVQFGDLGLLILWFLISLDVKFMIDLMLN
jgi:hypothetical protein